VNCFKEHGFEEEKIKYGKQDQYENGGHVPSQQRSSMSQCRYCGSHAVGIGCPFSPTKHHVHATDDGACRYCGSHAYGKGCPFSPSKYHVHGPGSKCSYCGSHAVGIGCIFSPNGYHDRFGG
jgi:hypothetical protein